MPGRLLRGTSGCSSRPGCSATNGTGVIASITSIAKDSSSCGTGLPGFRRTLTDGEDGGTYGDEEKGNEEKGDKEGDGQTCDEEGDEEHDGEEARNFGCAESVSHQRRSGKP